MITTRLIQCHIPGMLVVGDKGFFTKKYSYWKKFGFTKRVYRFYDCIKLTNTSTIRSSETHFWSLCFAFFVLCLYIIIRLFLAGDSYCLFGQYTKAQKWKETHYMQWCQDLIRVFIFCMCLFKCHMNSPLNVL